MTTLSGITSIFGGRGSAQQQTSVTPPPEANSSRKIAPALVENEEELFEGSRNPVEGVIHGNTESINSDFAQMRAELEALRQQNQTNTDAIAQDLLERLGRMQADVQRASGLADSAMGVYRTAVDVKDSVLETFAVLGSKAADAIAGFAAISANGSPAPFDHVSRGFLAFRGCSDLATIMVTLQDVATAVGETLIDPALDSLAKLGSKVANLAQGATRIGYLGAVLGMCTFPPILHVINIMATGASGALATVGSFSKYHSCLVLRRAGDADAKNGQITALLDMAANVSLVAFAVLSAQAASLSMVPVTVGTGAALAVSAGFAILAKLNEKLASRATPSEQDAATSRFVFGNGSAVRV